MIHTGPVRSAEAGVSGGGPVDRYRFRLYVAGSLPNSQQAQQNLRAICDARVPGRYDIEIIDFLAEPARGLADGIIVTPTLVMLEPGRPRTVVGTLADGDAVARALELPPAP